MGNRLKNVAGRNPRKNDGSGRRFPIFRKSGGGWTTRFR
ncbi:hypothetical protein THTE_4408 [Thermogutta terrifontis]|uniref:Uncharacterized protein n=1 Tax=Thermogutta terrifontis TaxID=1331910 RepID=A0A286RM14_9BACT|nr:hypothetical protein THTE_4408 [Thermogutta terrifontis]